ncbi:MAG TPA: CoA-acylating methylmalonate-semialdehyde dehydrogenase [Verrucomicrobiales bacterium]|nr:CoA-acylating methylmalonate-semialdehyde dehydrogenase [Verrucomicrobiales bacterium]HIL72064.1 CoA-acylating methylmalonate-semialdehyde dehydrogenase [Verrucomicrobiota bacterium]
MSIELHHFINGKKEKGDSGRFGDIYNPALGEVQSRVPFASREELDKTVNAALSAFPDWAATPPLKRARILFKFLELLNENAASLVDLIVSEHGKVREDALGSLTRGKEVVEFVCGIPHLLKGEFSADVGSRIDSWSLRQPLGVCAGITPFNFPAMVPMWMFPVAIACGNTFIIKPSEKDPSCMLRLAELASEAGLPPGVLNVLNGDKEAVDAILEHPEIRAVSFVGSTPVARHVYQESCAHGKRVQALAGAKNHLVVLPDADLEQVTNALMGAAYGSAGERCMAISVAVVVDSVADEVVDRLKKAITGLKVGAGTDPSSHMGPLVTGDHLTRVAGYVQTGVDEGAELVADGRGIKPEGFEQGFFLGACLFDKVTPEMKIYRDEIFGPVLCIVRVPDFESALKIVNGNAYGNGTAVFTRDGDAAREFSHRVQAGMVGINVPIPVPMAFHSFGGWKDSIFGDHAVHGMEGIRFYTKLKTVTSRWPTGIRSGAEFVMPTMK